MCDTSAKWIVEIWIRLLTDRIHSSASGNQYLTCLVFVNYVTMLATCAIYRTCTPNTLLYQVTLAQPCPLITNLFNISQRFAKFSLRFTGITERVYLRLLAPEPFFRTLPSSKQCPLVTDCIVRHRTVSCKKAFGRKATEPLI